MLIALLPNLHKLATICLSILISTASAEQSFADMKLIKNHLRNRLTEFSLSNLMKIIIESQKKNSLIVICKKLLTCGIEKVDGLLCKHSFRLLSYYICILSLLIHLSISIMIFNNTLFKWGRGKKVPRGVAAPLNETLVWSVVVAIGTGITSNNARDICMYV